jgi:hypothetical protein
MNEEALRDSKRKMVKEIKIIKKDDPQEIRRLLHPNQKKLVGEKSVMLMSGKKSVMTNLCA